MSKIKEFFDKAKRSTDPDTYAQLLLNRDVLEIAAEMDKKDKRIADLEESHAQVIGSHDFYRNAFKRSLQAQLKSEAELKRIREAVPKSRDYESKFCDENIDETDIAIDMGFNQCVNEFMLTIEGNKDE